MDTEEITKYIFLDDIDPQGDIALIFGTWKYWKRDSMKKAVNLYKNKKVKWVLLSHGVNPITQENEGDKMAPEILKLGVSKDKFLLENKASNTLDNVIFSRKLIDEKIGLKNVQSIVAVCANYHTRRVLMTLKKHMPPHIKIRLSPYVPSSVVHVTKDNWNETEEDRELVHDEIEKIAKYLAKGDLAEL